MVAETRMVRRSMAKWRDHRDAVRETLKRKKKTAYWLHGQIEGKLSRTHLYDYLRGEVGISVDLMQRINDVLGIRYTDE
jgi:hypothetical protein